MAKAIPPPTEPPVKKPRKDKDKLTLKQRKLIKGKSEGKTTREASKQAGLNEQYACELLKKPEIKATIQDLMEHMGLSDDALLIKHKELLNAQKQLSGVREAGSDSIEFVEVPDHAVQVKALEMAYKLKSAFVEKKEVELKGELKINILKFSDAK
jgi:phage terminase small subunit